MSSHMELHYDAIYVGLFGYMRISKTPHTKNIATATQIILSRAFFLENLLDLNSGTFTFFMAVPPLSIDF